MVSEDGFDLLLLLIACLLVYQTLSNEVKGEASFLMSSVRNA